MTLFHFANCMATSYAPYFILYKFSGLSEISAYWRCVKAGVAYFVTQLFKDIKVKDRRFQVSIHLHPNYIHPMMVLLATLFPIAPDNQQQSFKTILISESVRCAVDSLDFLGLYFILTKLLGRGEMKVLATVVGWGTTELVATRVLPTWVGARGLEFDWKFFQTSLDCNINMVLLLTSTGLLWLWSRNDLNKTLLPVILVMLGIILYRPLVFQCLQVYFDLSMWTVLLAKCLVCGILGFSTLQMYIAMTI